MLLLMLRKQQIAEEIEDSDLNMGSNESCFALLDEAE